MLGYSFTLSPAGCAALAWLALAPVLASQETHFVSSFKSQVGLNLGVEARLRKW